MFTSNDKISIRQLQALLFMSIFGTGIAALPGRTAEFAGQDSWISIIIAIIAAIICVFFITGVARMFPGKTFTDYVSDVLSYPVGVLLSVAFIIKIVINTALELRIFGEILRQVILRETPFSIVCLSMLIISAYASSKGYEVRGRLAEVLVFFTFIPLIIVFSIAAFDVDYTNLMPVLATPPIDILKGGTYTAFSFSGIELVLLTYPFINRPNVVRKCTIQTVIAVGVLMLIITIITIARFGPFELKRQMWPVIQILDTVYIPGAFMERQDALIMSFWIISVFARTNAGLFFISILCRSTINKGKHSSYVWASIPVIFIISIFPKNIIQTYEYTQFMNYTFGIAFMIVIPVILLAVAKLRRLGEAK